MAKSPEVEHPNKAFGWAARDTSGLLSPFNFSRRSSLSLSHPISLYFFFVLGAVWIHGTITFVRFPSLFFLASITIVDQVNNKQCTHVMFMGSKNSLFNNFFIKNGSHNTIHIFKNYFVTVFLIFNFSKINSIQTDP